MYIMSHLAGCFALIPVTMLLTVSFFVLFALQKVGPGRLKAFGTMVIILLWTSALLIFSAGIYKIYTGRMFFRCPIMERIICKKGLTGKEQAPATSVSPGAQNLDAKGNAAKCAGK